MKKNKDKTTDIVLDEENKAVENEKPTAKKIAIAVLLILLAVGLVCLGFCLTFGVFDSPISNNVAYAYNWSGSTLAEYVEGSVIYGFKIIDLDGFVSSYHQSLDNIERYWGAMFIECVNARTGDGDMYLTFYFEPQNECMTLFFDFDDSITYDNGIYSNISVLVGECGQNTFGIGYVYFDDGIIICDPYPVPSTPTANTDVPHFIWDNPYIQVLTTPLDNASSKLDEYENMFTAVREVFASNDYHRIYTCSKIDVQELDTLFVTNSSVKFTDLIDSDGNFIGNVYGLNPNVTEGSVGIWNRAFEKSTGVNSLYFFYFIAKIANLTPLPLSSTGNKGIVWNYNRSTKTLTQYSDVKTLPTVEMCEEYELLYRESYDEGKSDAENDIKNTTDSVISVLQSPINFLKTVFDFEIFGINLSAVVFFILSVVIVAFVIKKVV